MSILFITPEAMQETVNAVLSQYAGMLDTNTMNSVEQMMGKLPAITFFSNLIYCFLYGTVLSAILSSNIPSKNPFDRIDGAQTTDNQEDGTKAQCCSVDNLRHRHKTYVL